MAWVSLFLGLGGLIVAAIALRHTIVRDREQTKALADEREERKAADERAERRQLAANLVAESMGSSSSDRGTDYTIKVRNVGQSPAREVNLHLAERLPDGALSGATTLGTPVGTLVAGDGWQDCTLHSVHPCRSDGRRRSGVIVAYWIDGNGDHRDVDIGRADLVD